jgi:hypothetical protein
MTEARLEDPGSGLVPVTEGTEHGFVGAGEGPCAILMVGARTGPGVRYAVSEVAARYGACVDEETSDWRQAYANVQQFRRERPPNWSRLPWA